MQFAPDKDAGQAPHSERGFLVRDLIRFIVVDIILILSLRLMVALEFFSHLDQYVLAVLGSKVVLFLYLLWLIRDRREAWPATGADTAGRWWAWPVSLVIYAGCFPFLIWADRLNRYLLHHFHAWLGWVFVPSEQEVMRVIFGADLDPPVRMILVFFTVAAGPVMEELAFRGMGLDAFRRRYGLGAAIFWTSLLFGVFHFSAQMWLSLSLLGAVFAAARVLSTSLWCAVVVHCFHNTLVLAIMAYNLGYLDRLRPG